MVEKQAEAPTSKTGSKHQHEQRKSEDKAAAPLPEPVAVDRPGFDLGGSSGKTSAGTGLGLGRDAADSRSDQSLPGRRRKGT
ncbi:hypothetical protein [Thalassobaculum sp.]|uniref:hypothetical protein n=1 Tax=Thalassobaculum sp. TaxID=2022740 RepID=UPI0032ECBFA6